MNTAPEDSTCGRCTGKGIIEHFSHVVGGICFRCWGAGVDPRTAKQLEAWLARARDEYKARRTLKAAATDPARKEALAKELALIEKIGKQNKVRLASLVADYKLGQAWAKNKARHG